MKFAKMEFKVVISPSLLVLLDGRFLFMILYRHVFIEHAWSSVLSTEFEVLNSGLHIISSFGRFLLMIWESFVVGSEELNWMLEMWSTIASFPSNTSLYLVNRYGVLRISVLGFGSNILLVAFYLEFRSILFYDLRIREFELKFDLPLLAFCWIEGVGLEKDEHITGLKGHLRQFET